MEATFFARPAEWRRWLAQNHEQATELWVGFYKKDSGRESITWPEAVDEALCFGWIDGVRKSIDGISYAIRFTPRKPKSIWSAINIARIEALTRLGLMQPKGLEAFSKRTEGNSKVYSFEQESVQLGQGYEEQFRQNRQAWEFFGSQAPSYRKAAIWWVMSAKGEATRLKRLSTLIKDSESGQRVAHLRRSEKGK